MANAPTPDWVSGAREVSTSVRRKRLAVMALAIHTSGPAEAISTCQVEAVKMARAASQQTGWQVRRVSLAKRNPWALPTQALCLQSHGSTDKLGPGVAERLGQLYPADRATGYAVGQIRGAMTLRQPVQP